MRRRISAGEHWVLLAAPLAVLGAGCAPNAGQAVDVPRVETRRDQLRRLLEDRLRDVEGRLVERRSEASLDERLRLVVALRILDEARPEDVDTWTLADVIARAEATVARAEAEDDGRAVGGIGAFARPGDDKRVPNASARGGEDDAEARRQETATHDLPNVAEEMPAESADGWTLQPAPMGAMVQTRGRVLPEEVEQELLAQGARLRLCAVELRDEVRFEVRAHLYRRRLRGVVVEAAPSQPAAVTDCVADVFASLELPEHDAPTQAVLFPFAVRP